MADAALSAPAKSASHWTNIATAADLLGISSSSLRRRLCYPHWVEGRHYRWISKGQRKTLQVNYTEADRLIRLRGW